MIAGCTKKACFEYETPECTKCMGNSVWTDCGSICTPTCDEPAPICPAVALLCVGVC